MATFADHFTPVADAYAAARPSYPPELAAWLAEASPATGAAWEVGCGSGQLTASLASHFTRVLATDPSAAQLARAPQLANVTYVVAPAEAAPLAASTCDLVVAAQAAHWFDLPRFLAEAARVGRPGALLALIAYGRAELDDAAAQAALDALFDGVLGPWWPPARRHVEAGYATLDVPLPRVAAPPLVIALAWTLPQLVDYVGTWSAVGAARAGGAALAVDAALDDLARAWGPPATARVVRWPLTALAARLPG